MKFMRLPYQNKLNNIDEEVNFCSWLILIKMISIISYEKSGTIIFQANLIQRVYLCQNELTFKAVTQQQMKVNKVSPPKGKSKARKLGLTSSRFHEDNMSKNAEEAVEYVKKKDRSYLELKEWRDKKYYKTDATMQLRDCPSDVDRVDAETLTVEEFIDKYQRPNKTVIIKGCCKDWNVKQRWTHEYFYRNFKDFKFKIGEDDSGSKLRVPFRYYLQYLLCNKDDSPLYLFQSSLQDKPQTRRIMNNYEVPKYFNDDLFKYAGDKNRPPYRWFIMGPQRSGTTVHKDPLMTSAWNASLAGHKRWVLFPATIPKSIVKGKQFRGKNYQDEAINYFVEILPKIKQKYTRQQLQITQFIQYPGEVVFVPGGVWHAVINLDDTIAVTQNVMTHVNFDIVWKSTRCERRKFAQYFLDKLKQYERDLYERAMRLNEQDEYVMGNKYAKQEVSLSFTPSSSSSSSSSSSYSSQSDNDKKEKTGGDKKNKVETKRKGRSKSRSRSREQRNRKTLSEEKASTISKRSYDL